MPKGMGSLDTEVWARVCTLCVPRQPYYDPVWGKVKEGRNDERRMGALPDRRGIRKNTATWTKKLCHRGGMMVWLHTPVPMKQNRCQQKALHPLRGEACS